MPHTSNINTYVETPDATKKEAYRAKAKTLINEIVELNGDDSVNIQIFIKIGEQETSTQS